MTGPLAAARGAARRRVAVRVAGVVQGVGFRPFVHRLAAEHALAGHVLNDSAGVLAEVEGDPAAVQRFLAALEAHAPPLSRIEEVAVRECPPQGTRGFAIRPSPAGDAAHPPRVPVTPDSATCADCLREVLDPADRRHRYPFTNCTNCGPRFTIVRDVPYDRPATTMAAFTMCDRCRAEYEDPADRRFHAQPNACPDCGPRARLVDAGDRELPPADGAPDAVATAAALLRDGAVLAVKGLGGYHLACRADDERAVAALRARKHREHRPFALMAADPAAAARLVALDDVARGLLTSPARPIVLAPRRPDAPVAASVAPRAAELGVMLPYTPLHHLLLTDLGGPALVLTSGNRADEPIAHEDDDARERLAAIADAFLVHDRPIHVRADDGVVRVARTAPPVPVWVRRSRGSVPDVLRLPVPAAADLLACGAELKATFCVARGDRAWVGHHLGDLRTPEVLRSFTDGVPHFERLFDVHPRLLVHDLHPDLLSTAYARERADAEGLALLAVQHHHAHLAAVLAEHGKDPGAVAVGAIYDGSGLGPDGTVWGGEILVGGQREATRAGALWPVRLPGGDRAVREPWRMACAWLVAAQGEDAPAPETLAGAVDPATWSAVRRMAATGFSSPVTTSMGRFLDAIGALCGVRTHVTYEGQAAIELETLADPAVRDGYDLPVLGDGTLDGRAAVADVVADLARGTPVPAVAARAHAAVAAATAAAVSDAAGRAGTGLVVLAGGVFLNRLLLERTTARLRAAGLEVLLPRALPPGDGAISFGQAAVAAARAAD